MGSVLHFVPVSVTAQVAVVAVVVGMTVYFRMKKQYRLPPGPQAVPFLGNVLCKNIYLFVCLFIYVYLFVI